jgi:hypothetical protein
MTCLLLGLLGKLMRGVAGRITGRLLAWGVHIRRIR